MKDNKQFIANSPYEGNGTSYFQMMNDNSISKEDRILNKDIIYLKPASNYTKLLKTDENYFNISNLNSLRGDTNENFNKLIKIPSAQTSFSNKEYNNNNILNVKLPSNQSKINDNYLTASNNSFSNNPLSNNIRNNFSDPKEILNYSNEFKNYQNLIGKMKSEISSLNQKLSVIENNNSNSNILSQNLLKNSNFPLDFNSMIKEKEQKINNVIEFTDFKKRNISPEKNDKSPDNFIFNTKIINKTFSNSNHENHISNMANELINQLPNKTSLISSSLIQNSNTENKKIVQDASFISTKKDYVSSKVNKREINRINRPKSISHDNLRDKNQRKSSINNKTNVPIQSKKKFIPKSTSKYDISQIASDKSFKKANLSLDEENKDLKLQIETIETLLRNQYGFTNFDKYEENQAGKSLIRLELEIYKTRTENLSEKFLDTIREMSSSIYNDKELFLRKIKEINLSSTKSINDLKKKYEPILTKYSINIAKYKKENEMIKNKLSNMKKILSDI